MYIKNYHSEKINFKQKYVVIVRSKQSISWNRWKQKQVLVSFKTFLNLFSACFRRIYFLSYHRDDSSAKDKNVAKAGRTRKRAGSIEKEIKEEVIQCRRGRQKWFSRSSFFSHNYHSINYFLLTFVKENKALFNCSCKIKLSHFWQQDVVIRRRDIIILLWNRSCLYWCW